MGPNTTNHAAHQILVVDDHPTFRRGVRALLDSTPDLRVCAEAGDVQEARECMRSHNPELVLVDLALKDGSGLELLKEIGEQRPNMPILVLSVHDEKLYAERALEAGARGYLMKDAALNDVVDAIRRVLKNQVVLSASATQQLLKRKIRGESGTDSPLSRLSDRQLQVFELLGRGRRTREIAATMFISNKTVETHISNIKRRLGMETLEELRAQAAIWVNQNMKQTSD